jgi:N-acetylneuraminic acid mutarotase
MKQKEGRALFLLNRMHQQLADSLLWYKKWHSWKGSSLVHAAIFLAATVATLSYLAIAVKPVQIKASTQEWTNTGWNSWTFDDAEKFGTRIRLETELTDASATMGGTLPSARRASAAAWNPDDNKFYIFGGQLFTPQYETAVQSDQIVVYDPITDSTTTKTATLPQELSHSTAVWSPTENKFYIFGGVHANPPIDGNPQSPSAQTFIMEYDPVTDILTEKSSTISASVAVGASAVWSTTTNKAYIIGGRSVMFSSPSSTIYAYDPATDSVSSAVSMPNGRDFTVSVWDSANELIYIVGGYTNSGGYRMTNTILEFNPVANTITTKSATLPGATTFDTLNPYRLPTAGYYDVTQEKIILGAIVEGASTTYSNALLSYTPTTNTVAAEAGTLSYSPRETIGAYSETSNLGFFFGGIPNSGGDAVPVVNTIAQAPQYSFKATGTAQYVYTPSAGTIHDWQSIVVNTTLNGQTVTAQYTNNTDCTTGLVSSLALVPNSESLCIKLTLATADPFVSPRVSSVLLTYEAVVEEPDPTPSPSPTDEVTPTPDPEEEASPSPDPIEEESPSPDPVDDPSPSPVVDEEDDTPAVTAPDPTPTPSPSPSPTPVAVASPSPALLAACSTGIQDLTVTAYHDRVLVNFDSPTAVISTLYIYEQSKTATAGSSNQKATGYANGSTRLQEGGASREHSMLVSDLQPNKTYYYTLLLGSGQDCEHSFTTQAAPIVATVATTSPTIVISPIPTPTTSTGTTTRRTPQPSQNSESGNGLLAAPSLFSGNLPPQAEIVLGVTTRTALGATILAAVIPLIVETALNSLNMVTSIPSFFTSLWLNLIQLLSRKKKRRPWGVAKDSFSGEELQNTIISLIVIDSNNNEKVLERCITDKQGRFGFLAGTGTYRLHAQHDGFSYPTKVLLQSYLGTPFRIEESQPLDLTLYLDRLIKRTNWSFLLKKVIVFLEKFRLPLLIFGTIIAIFNYLNYPYIQINVIFLVFYIILWILELVNVNKSRNTIQFVDEHNQPLPFTLVRFVNDKTGQVAAHKVTDKAGEIYLLVAAGHYTAIVPSPRNPQGAMKKIHLPQGVAPRHMKIKIEY